MEESGPEKPSSGRKGMGCLAAILLKLASMVVFIALYILCRWCLFWIPDQSIYSITERYLFTSPEQDTKVYLGMLAPRSGPYQTVEDLRVSWDGE